jgi:hypothetical protein
MALFTNSRIGYLATLGAGILIGVIAVGTSVAATSSGTAKVATHHYALAASAFAPDASGTAPFGSKWDPPELFDDGDRCFSAGLSLPVNATLKSIRVFFIEGSVPMLFEVTRQNLLNHTFSQLVHDDTPDTSVTPFYNSVSKPVPHGLGAVDMRKYAYSAGVCPSDSTRFSGLIITYTVPRG